MAGHNKWSKVKHIKARVDAIKGRVFSRCAHEIALAARSGGGDPSANARLRTAIDNAKAVSMPKENIERAIRKGTGELGGDAIQEVTYEGYGPGGVAFLVEMATDNLNRSAADMRTIFTKNNGSVATPGSVSYQFDRKGRIAVPASALSENDIMERAILAGADDVMHDEEEHVIFTSPAALAHVASELRLGGLPITSESFVSLPQTTTILADDAQGRQIIKLHDQLEDYPDTVHVFSNFEISDELAAALGE